MSGPGGLAGTIGNCVAGAGFAELAGAVFGGVSIGMGPGGGATVAGGPGCSAGVGTAAGGAALPTAVPAEATAGAEPLGLTGPAAPPNVFAPSPADCLGPPPGSLDSSWRPLIFSSAQARKLPIGVPRLVSPNAIRTNAKRAPRSKVIATAGRSRRLRG